MASERFTRLIGKYSETLASGLVKVLHESERTDAYRRIPATELQHDLRELYQHLDEWLGSKTQADIQKRFSYLGSRRASQQIPLEQFVWALILAKEHLWYFLQREAVNDSAMQLLNELEFVFSLEQFFDRALYYVCVAYRAPSRDVAA